MWSEGLGGRGGAGKGRGWVGWVPLDWLDWGIAVRRTDAGRKHRGGIGRGANLGWALREYLRVGEMGQWIQAAGLWIE